MLKMPGLVAASAFEDGSPIPATRELSSPARFRTLRSFAAPRDHRLGLNRLNWSAPGDGVPALRPATEVQRRLIDEEPGVEVTGGPQ